MKLTNRKDNPGRCPEIEDATQRDDEPAIHHQHGMDMVDNAAAGVLAVALIWLSKRAMKLALWASAAGAVGCYAYLAYNPQAALGAAMLALAIAMMISPADSVPGRINASLTSAAWMLIAVVTAGAALGWGGGTLGAGAYSRPLQGQFWRPSC
jgi:hypothetical protein